MRIKCGECIHILFQDYQIQILEISTFFSKVRRKITSFLFEITELFDGFVSQRKVKFLLALEFLSFTKQVDEKISYDLITIKRYDHLLGRSSHPIPQSYTFLHRTRPSNSSSFNSGIADIQFLPMPSNFTEFLPIPAEADVFMFN
jgi:hypothetical protein